MRVGKGDKDQTRWEVAREESGLGGIDEGCCGRECAARAGLCICGGQDE